MHQDKTPAAAHRVQVLPDHAGRSGNPHHQVVWVRRGLQRHGDGAAGAKPRGPLQFLLQAVQPQDGPAAGRPAHLTDRVHPLQKLHPQRHQARQLSHVSTTCLLRAILSTLKKANPQNSAI